MAGKIPALRSDGMLAMPRTARTRALMVLIPAASISLVSVLHFAYGVGMPYIASFVTVAVLLASPTAYLLKKWDREDTEAGMAAANLYRELKDALNSLDRDKFGESVITFISVTGDRVSVMGRRLNHDFYDSLVYSGRINFLYPALQQHIQNVFAMIKDHNRYLELVRGIALEAGEVSPPQSRYLLVWLEKTEKTLLAEIPGILGELERLGVSSQE